MSLQKTWVQVQYYEQAGNSLSKEESKLCTLSPPCDKELHYDSDRPLVLLSLFA